MIQRTVLEWESIAHGELPGQIPVSVADRIAAAAAASHLSGKNGSNVLEHARKGLRAKGIVGVVSDGSCALEILPKIDSHGADNAENIGTTRRRLIHMLAVAFDIEIDAGKLTALDWQNQTILEILIRLFSQKLTDAVRKGMPRQYLAHVEDLPSLRGRLDAIRQFSILAANPARLASQYDALTADIALNQIMKAATCRLAHAAGTAENRHRLRELSLLYADISDVSASSLRWDQVALDRTNCRWEELVNLARLLLAGQYQTTSMGKSNGFALLFDMGSLFEEYVAKMLRQALQNTCYTVVAQGGRLHCLRDGERGLFQTKPDILVKRGDDIIQIIDTKWKRISGRIDDPKRGVAQSDVYQMMAYGQLYKCSRLMLLYPHYRAIAEGDGVQESYSVTGSSQSLQAATIDISLNHGIFDRLKSLVMRAEMSAGG